MCVHSRQQCKYRPSVYTIILLLIRFVIGRLTKHFPNWVTLSSTLAVILSISRRKILYSANINTVDQRCPLEKNRINRFLINSSAEYNVREYSILLHLCNKCTFCVLYLYAHRRKYVLLFLNKNVFGTSGWYS